MSYGAVAFLRAAIKIRLVGAGPSYEWRGQGVSEVQRTGVGVFVVTLDENVDISQSISAASPYTATGVLAESYFANTELTMADCTIRVFDNASAPADPDGISFTLNSDNTEMDWTAV